MFIFFISFIFTFLIYLMMSIIKSQKEDELEVIQLEKEIQEGLTQLAYKNSSHLSKKPDQID